PRRPRGDPSRAAVVALLIVWGGEGRALRVLVIHWGGPRWLGGRTVSGSCSSGAMIGNPCRVGMRGRASRNALMLPSRDLQVGNGRAQVADELVEECLELALVDRGRRHAVDARK